MLSREVDRKNPVEVREANKYMLADAAVALFVAFLLNFAVISCFAELFFNIGTYFCSIAVTPWLMSHAMGTMMLLFRLRHGFYHISMHRRFERIPPPSLRGLCHSKQRELN